MRVDSRPKTKLNSDLAEVVNEPDADPVLLDGTRGNTTDEENQQISSVTFGLADDRLRSNTRLNRRLPQNVLMSLNRADLKLRAVATHSSTRHYALH